MRNENKTNKPGNLYLAFVLCFCVVAVAAVFGAKSNLDQLNPKDDKNINLSQDMNENGMIGQDVVKPVPTRDSKSSTSQSGVQSMPEQKKSSEYIKPLNGTVTVGYSGDTPIYSKTLEQYEVHNGVDITAAADTPVKASAAGTITKVYIDDKLGNTVCITHGNGVITQYSNLTDAKVVGEGDVVEQGDQIGAVGASALFESMDEPHLHFAVWKDGQLEDPGKYIDVQK